MLKVTVEIWPAGDPNHSRTIHTLAIGNISNLADISDYSISVDGLRPFVLRNHRRSDGALLLVEKALRAARRNGLVTR